jgi:hypothetical protein
MTFRVGQKVVCVDESTHDRGGWHPLSGIPQVGEIYTVTALGTHRGMPAVRLREIRNGAHDGYYRAKRFRPAVERKTDISVFTEILRRTTLPAKTLALSATDGGSGS